MVAEVPVDRVEEYDSYGRLRKVRELSGPVNAHTPDMVINEVDADSNGGADTDEFIELYGPPHKSLDDYVVVLYNGSNLRSYRAYNLGRLPKPTTTAIFVMGDLNLPGVDYGAWEGNTLQEGPDAVAVYLGDASSFPNGTLVHENSLVDALVYDTNDGDVPGLIDVLTPGQEQVDESAGMGGATVNANARMPNGGKRLQFLKRTDPVRAATPNPRGTQRRHQRGDTHPLFI